jgi:hypothetical protein
MISTYFLVTQSAVARILTHTAGRFPADGRPVQLYFAGKTPFARLRPSRVICKGRLTMEEIIFSLKHYWRFVDCEALELQALSWEVSEKAT